MLETETPEGNYVNPVGAGVGELTAGKDHQEGRLGRTPAVKARDEARHVLGPLVDAVGSAKLDLHRPPMRQS